MKEHLADETVEAASGGGMVKVVMNGKFELLSIEIEPEIIDKEEAEMLETLVAAQLMKESGWSRSLSSQR